MNMNNTKEMEIKTLFGSIEEGFENDFESRNFKFFSPGGMVRSKNQHDYFLFR